MTLLAFILCRETRVREDGLGVLDGLTDSCRTNSFPTSLNIEIYVELARLTRDDVVILQIWNTADRTLDYDLRLFDTHAFDTPNAIDITPFEVVVDGPTVLEYRLVLNGELLGTRSLRISALADTEA